MWLEISRNDQHNSPLGFYLYIMNRDLCKTPPFAQFRRQAQILILKILNVFLWLKFSPFLVLNKIERFSKVSIKFNL
jgi:hypothetical protein